ncbi:flagellar basal body rod protein FlgB [Photobacterium sp. BZF1]|uniref:flagellar basal body protein n=1 Tax=Photobacterium sp. BZF1 TaxID=1904457 RepID=UPI0016539D7D|nr:flagellar basal body protein [Photobacterium sp. BZF1]MBC7001596.1 flagellar basal body rod protein FlgB [Photobacterium sp. BZF1]
MINLDNALGVHPEMLSYRLERTAVLSSNIANVDTPNYKSMDIQFDAVMGGLGNGSDWQISTSLKYRIPMQRSRDGNTVELETEQARFAQNVMDYHQSLAFLQSKLNGLKTAIKGQ